MRFEFSIFQCFKGFTVFLCEINLPLESKTIFLHPKVSFSVIFYEFPYFNLHPKVSLSVIFFEFPCFI